MNLGRPTRVLSGLLAVLLSLALPHAARASFHLMQIEQIIGGVGGDTSAQAVQLRFRAGFQNQLQLGRVKVYDAAGANPIVIKNFSAPLAQTASGTRVLLTTAAFNAAASPAAVSDFTMAPIPASYLAAGRLTWEDTGGTILWSVAWGGAAYTGPTSGALTNDADGQFGKMTGPLPSTGVQALRFSGAATALSVTNPSDYALTTGAAVFTNAAGAAFTVQAAAATNPSGTGSASPTLVRQGERVLLSVLTVPGANPVSTGLGVRVNLVALGGSATQQLFDNATNGDATAGDGRFSFAHTVALTAAQAGVILTATVTDAQGRTGSAPITLTVTCTADWNKDGEVNGNDISDFINSWYGDITGGTVVADANADGETNGNDISDYINLWYASIVNGGGC